MDINAMLRAGVDCHQSGDFEQAEKIYQQILTIEPENSQAILFMGVLAYNVDKLDIARIYMEKAMELSPGNPACYVNLGNVCQSENKYKQAIGLYEKCIELDKNHIQAFSNLGVAWTKTGEFKKAADSLQRAIKLNPDYAEAHNNIGKVFEHLGKEDLALDHYNKALKIAPDFVEPGWNKSLLQLTRGDFVNGWQGYELRWKRQNALVRKIDAGQKWQGQNLNGKTIFVYEEQGLGDTLQFIRFLPLLKKQGAIVIFEVLPSLLRLVLDSKELFDRLWAGIKGVDTRKADRFDYHVPLLSLPNLFKIDINTIPADIPYLRADTHRSSIWEKRLAMDDCFKIGITWSGHPQHKNDTNRSVHLSLFSGIAKIKNVKLISLQKEKQEKWTDIDPNLIFYKDMGDEIEDFADTAAIIDNLDLVISVDTAIVHLAGGLGKSVWTLIPFLPDWRWMKKREDTPWYPDMKLFRQPAPHDWQSVFKNIEQNLAKIIDYPMIDTTFLI